MKLLILALFITAAYGCQLPQNTWCDSVENAVKCNVLDQCRKYVWYIGNTNDAYPKVRVDLYYESLCPFCRMFITKQLKPTYQKLKDIMEIYLYPFGNAMETKTSTGYNYTCQHGPNECVGNLIETCAIALLQDFDKYFEFISCMEEGDEEDPAKAAQRCGQSIDLNSIMKCANSSLGQKLEHKIAASTQALNPPHKYVPWIVINNVHTNAEQQQAQSNLAQIVCDKYTGIKPAACRNLSMMPQSVCPR